MRHAQELAISFPPDLGALPSVRRSMRNWLAAAGISGPVGEDIVLAAWELCANAVEHPLRVGELRLVARSDGARVQVQVSDSGGWRTPVERRHRGLGLVLVGLVMDDMTIECGAEGTLVRISRDVGPDR